MAITLKLSVNQTVSRTAQELRDALKPGAIENAMGRGVANLVRNHLFALNQSRPNQLGGRRTNFWAQAARGTSQASQPGGFTVSINQVGFRQRYQGGWIRPTGGKKYLTIPAVAEAHGRRASEFSNLRFGFAANKYGNLQPALIEASATKVKFGRARKDGTRGVKSEGTGGKVMFFLSKRVFQQADASVLPTLPEMEAAAVAAADAVIAAALAKGGNDARN